MRIVSCILVFLVLFLGCATPGGDGRGGEVTAVDVEERVSEVVEEAVVDKPEIVVINGEIEDLRVYSQDVMFYAGLVDDVSAELLTKEEQEKYFEDFKKKFYQAWVRPTLASFMLSHYRGELEALYKNAGIGENKLPRGADFADEIKRLADLDGGFNTNKNGIMMQYAHIRKMPTNKPFYLDFALAGEGYPFDYWQQSTIPIGTPVYVYHQTEHWALIESHITHGWVPKNRITFIDDHTIKSIIDAPKIAITEEKVAIYENVQTYSGRFAGNNYIGFADIGTVFSVVREGTDHYVVYGGTHNFYRIPKDIAKPIPIAPTTANIAELASKMMMQEYGWGGMYFNRDCSQMLLDLYIGFGILLPRNGSNQAFKFGRYHSLADIDDPALIKQEIVSIAVPFLTLVRIPGHIMLYVGHLEGEPLVLHNIWGIRTKEDEVEGRHIIGRTVITTLEAGKDLPHIIEEMMLINRMEGVTFFR